MCLGVGTAAPISASVAMSVRCKENTMQSCFEVKPVELNQVGDHTHHRKTVELELWEPDRSNNHVSGAVSEIGRSWSQFMSLETLEWDPGTNRQHLKDDCLLFRVPQVEVYESSKPQLS